MDSCGRQAIATYTILPITPSPLSPHASSPSPRVCFTWLLYSPTETRYMTAMERRHVCYFLLLFTRCYQRPQTHQRAITPMEELEYFRYRKAG